MKLRLNSEYGTLRAVLIHRPGKEIDRLTPYNISDLLFEDVPYLEEMQVEHDSFTNIIKQVSGAKVYRLTNLLMQVLKDKNLLLKVFDEILKDTSLSFLAQDVIDNISTAEATTALVAGLKVKELKKKIHNKALDKHQDNEFLIRPNPNLYFMRDPAAIVQTGIISSQMKYPARQRESMILKLVLENHPDFKDNHRLIFPNTSNTKTFPSIEGGDVIVLSKKSLAIGRSERTDAEAIQEVARQVLKDDSVERVYEVDLPRKRNFMHLDTVFTIIDENLVVTYPDAVNSVLETKVYFKEDLDSEGNVILRTENLGESLLKILKKEIPHLDIIETGYGNPDYASREQWFDGANVFAIGPRQVISYNRNRYTNRALKEAGVEVIEIRGSELVRGLGGPRCMTMPLEREEL
jgi:arginine deiminase